MICMYFYSLSCRSYFFGFTVSTTQFTIFSVDFVAVPYFDSLMCVSLVKIFLDVRLYLICSGKKSNENEKNNRRSIRHKHVQHTPHIHIELKSCTQTFKRRFCVQMIFTFIVVAVIRLKIFFIDVQFVFIFLSLLLN